VPQRPPPSPPLPLFTPLYPHEPLGGWRGQFHYYLYALERLGVLYDTPTVGSHKWYPEEAALLLGVSS